MSSSRDAVADERVHRAAEQLVRDELVEPGDDDAEAQPLADQLALVLR